MKICKWSYSHASAPAFRQFFPHPPEDGHFIKRRQSLSNKPVAVPCRLGDFWALIAFIFLPHTLALFWFLSSESASGFTVYYS